MPDHTSKVRWEAENVIHAHIKINRNQDPDLYQLVSTYPGSKGEIIRQLLREALAARN